MSLAGLDPSAGAGLLADIKTFEVLRTYGLGVCTAWTVQTDEAFFSVEWMPPGRIMAQAAPLLEKFPVQYCKVGIVAHPEVLLEILPAMKKIRPGLRFILDPVLKASAGYTFHAELASQWEAVLPHLFLLTPNYEEAIAICGEPSGEIAAKKMAEQCTVLLKGGHRPGKQGWDTLYTGDGYTDFPPAAESVAPKHGSGCVLSAAITAYLARGLSVEGACRAAKDYTLKFLQSSPGLLGHHHA